MAIKYFGKIVTEKELIADLRERGTDKNNELSDEFLIHESHAQFEWTEVTECHKCKKETEVMESFDFCQHCLTHL